MALLIRSFWGSGRLLPKEHLNDALKEVRALGGDVLQLPPEEDEMYPTKLENSSFLSLMSLLL